MKKGGWIAGLIVLGLAIAYWKVIIGVAIIGLLIWGGYVGGAAWLHKRQDRLDKQRVRNSALAARADYQHQQYLAGEDRGLYGEFKPASLD